MNPKGVRATALARAAVAFLTLSPLSAAAEPVTLTLSFNSSDQSLGYLTLVKPFVDAINSDRRGLLKIDVNFSGKLGTPAQQPQLVADGKADIALVIPGIDSKRFPDEAVTELPGLFRDAREASLGSHSSCRGKCAAGIPGLLHHRRGRDPTGNHP